MALTFNNSLAESYKSHLQIARVLTEDWVLNNGYCPSCGNIKLNKYNNNNHAADFFCIKCKLDYELKSSKTVFSKKVVDGSYSTMIKKIIEHQNPSIFFLNYTSDNMVKNFFIIPNYFFTPEIIEERKPLSHSARRAGWIGCNILIGKLPESGRIFLIKDNTILDKKEVIKKWGKTIFLKNEELNSRGWLIELMSIIDSVPNKIFKLSDIYNFEQVFKDKFPKNRFVREKIRQQLQVLRDKGFISFIGKGIYQKG
jgi:type II restriction enzyme